jgi:hypothetical protein
MSKTKDARDKYIGNWYVQLRRERLSQSSAINHIFRSEENQQGWCLSANTIRIIVTYKGYRKKA